ncbi:MAG: HK97 family phage prohead protease [Brevundimonas sp.]|nr:HK97 family phage prohead protease [Brevundimonas sp.]
MTNTIQTRRAPDHQTRRDARMPVARLAVTPRSYDAEAHTVELVAATGYPVRRYDWEAGTYYFERLEISTEAINGERVEKGVAPLLDAHSSWAIADQLGRIEEQWVEGGELITKVKFGTSTRAVEAEGEVAAGTWRGVSIGYRRDEIRKELATATTLPTYTVTRWTLLEVSMVPIPADPDAGVRSEESFHPCSIIETREVTDAVGTVTPQEDENMNRSRLMGGIAAAAFEAPADRGAAPAAPVIENRSEPSAPAAPAVAAEQERAAPAANGVRLSAVEAIDFVEQARSFGIPATDARGWVETLTPDAARSQLLARAAENQSRDAPRQAGQSTARIVTDERDTHRSAMANALEHRHNPSVELTDAGRQYRGMTLMEMARANLERNGERVGGLGKREVADLALRQHSTSDFPNVLSNVTRATLRRGYEEDAQTFKRWMRRASVPDFRQVSRLQMGAAPSFLLVPEGGEFKMGSIGDGKEVYSLATYGRRFSITRQTIINDDVDAFTRVPQMMGAAAARFESDAAYAPLLANPNMSDGNALFSAAHGNLAGSGGVPSEATVNAAEIAMGKQTGLSGEILNITPKYVIVARKDGLAVRKLLTAVQATQTSGVNVYAGEFEPIVESRLNRAAGATPWFMAADPNQVDTIEYAYLEGDDGVFLDERVGFEVDGIEYKARLDFATKAIDWRGLYMDPGV